MRETEIDPRQELYLRLPRFTQPLITWLSGIPYLGEQQKIKITSLLVILNGCWFISLGLAIFYLSGDLKWFGAIPCYIIGFLFLVGGTRRLDVLIIHQSLHNKVFKRKSANKFIGEALSILLFRTPYAENKREHLGHHSGPCDENDGDVQFLKDAGIAFCASKNSLYVQLLKAMLSPKFHFKFIKNRVMSNLAFSNPLIRLFLSWAYISLLFIPTYFWGSEYIIKVTLYWLVPIFIGFQISTFVYTATEHRWWIFNNQKQERTKDRDKLNFARVCCNIAPEKTGYTQWMKWWIVTLLIHVPTRLFIIVGDTLQHDLHHVVVNCTGLIQHLNVPFGKKENLIDSQKYGEDLLHI